MQCSSCGNPLSPTATFCPVCGAATPYAVSPSGNPPYVSSAYDASPQAPPPPSTDYGSPPYGLSEPIYSTFNPYEVVPPPPPPPPLPPPPRRKSRLGLLIGTVVLVLILASVGVFAFFQLAKTSRTTSVSSSPTTSIQATPTVVAPSPTLAVTAATTTAGNTPYGSYNGTLVLNDPLHDNSQGYHWQEGSDSNGSCTFTSGGYRVKSQNGGYFYPCSAQNTDYSNFVFEVQMKIMQGDCGAILFRVNSTVTSFYYYRVCQDGSSALFLYTNNSGTTVIASHPASGIHAGLNQSNLLAIVAQGSTLMMYINHQQTDSTSDNTYSHGEISFVADGYPNNHPTEVVYSNAKLWKF